MASRGPLKLHLGCGSNYKKGWLNVDTNSIHEYDLKHDLNRMPWPWKANSVDRILAEHVIEHVKDWERFMAECYRVLKPGGRVTIATPHASYGWMHPYHRHAFTINTMYYYNKYNPDKPLRKISERLIYSRDARLMLLSIPLTIAANLFGSFTRKLCDRVWAYWFGGFEEIRWVLEKP